MLGAALALVLVFLSPDRAGAEVCDATCVLDPAVSRILSRAAARLGVEAPRAWTLPTARAFAVRAFARPANSERLSDAARRRYAANFAALQSGDVDALEADFVAAGFCAAVVPPRRTFDYVLLNGSTARNVRQRIDALAQAVTSGTVLLTPATKVVFLDGERALFAAETPAVLLDPAPYPREPGWRVPDELPTDERGMDEMLWGQMQLPTALRRQGITFVHAQKRPGAARAETADCVQAWVRAHQPAPGAALVVSNNPFVEYQRRVTEVLLAQSGAADIEAWGLGPAAELSAHDPATRLGLLLDALAGTLARAEEQRVLGLLRAPPPPPAGPMGPNVQRASP